MASADRELFNGLLRLQTDMRSLDMAGTEDVKKLVRSQAHLLTLLAEHILQIQKRLNTLEARREEVDATQ
jgi:hypothetical protein